MGGLPAKTINGFAVSPADPNAMYAAMRDGVFRSADGGQTWKRADGPKNVAAVAVNPKRPSEIYAATVDGALWVSEDAGQRWRRR